MSEVFRRSNHGRSVPHLAFRICYDGRKDAIHGAEVRQCTIQDGADVLCSGSKLVLRLERESSVGENLGSGDASMEVMESA